MNHDDEAQPRLTRADDGRPEQVITCRHCGAPVLVDDSLGVWLHEWSGLIACHLLEQDDPITLSQAQHEAMAVARDVFSTDTDDSEPDPAA
jgi:hypothetical protein